MVCIDLLVIGLIDGGAADFGSFAVRFALQVEDGDSAHHFAHRVTDAAVGRLVPHHRTARGQQRGESRQRGFAAYFVLRMLLQPHDGAHGYRLVLIARRLTAPGGAVDYDPVAFGVEADGGVVIVEQFRVRQVGEPLAGMRAFAGAALPQKQMSPSVCHCDRGVNQEDVVERTGESVGNHQGIAQSKGAAGIVAVQADLDTVKPSSRAHGTGGDVAHIADQYQVTALRPCIDTMADAAAVELSQFLAFPLKRHEALADSHAKHQAFIGLGLYLKGSIRGEEVAQVVIVEVADGKIGFGYTKKQFSHGVNVGGGMRWGMVNVVASGHGRMPRAESHGRKLRQKVTAENHGRKPRGEFAGRVGVRAGLLGRSAWPVGELLGAPCKLKFIDRHFYQFCVGSALQLAAQAYIFLFSLVAARGVYQDAHRCFPILLGQVLLQLRSVFFAEDQETRLVRFCALQHLHRREEHRRVVQRLAEPKGVNRFCILFRSCGKCACHGGQGAQESQAE